MDGQRVINIGPDFAPLVGGEIYEVHEEIEGVDEPSCGVKIRRCSVKLASGVILVGIVAFIQGGFAGYMLNVGGSWVFHNTMHVINYEWGVSLAKIGSCLAIGWKTIGGLFRAPYAGLFKHRVSLGRYLSTLVHS